MTLNLIPPKSLIYLIGMMGAGKTTVAPILAQKLSYSFADTDLEVEKLTGKSCHQIVDEIGVEGFRSLETKILGNIVSRNHLVVACGGGIVTRTENWQYLQQNNSIVIWLNLPLEEIHKRIKNELRPNLRGLDSQQLMVKLREIYTVRHSLYAKADIFIKLDGSESPQEVASKIYQRLQNFCDNSKVKSINSLIELTPTFH